MGRKVVSDNELIELMNEYLHENEDLKDCRFTSVKKLQEVNEVDCNWIVPSYALRCSGVPEEICVEPAHIVVNMCMGKYNLE